MNRHIHLVLLVALMAIASGGAKAQSEPSLRTPQTERGYALGVSGHTVARLAHDLILMLGGCNFADQPAAEGGTKRFYSDIYATNSIVEGGRWRLLGHLPHPVAYAAAQVYDDRLVVAGGQGTGGEALRSVYALSVDEGGALLIDTLPELPEPRSGMASALVRSRLYLIGGNLSGRLTNSVISLDLSDPSEGWREEEPYPGPALLKVLATDHWQGDEPCLVLWGAFAHSEGEQGVSTSLACYLLVVDKPRPEWQPIPLPDQTLREGATFGGGIMLDYGEEEIMLAGGVNERKFLPALQRAQALRRAKRTGDAKTIRRLEAESKAYLLHEPEWYQFTPFILIYNFTTGKWHRDTIAPDLARADAAYLEGMIIGGEIKPGIRTNSIAIIQP